MPISHITPRRTVGGLVNCELERMWKGTVVSCWDVVWQEAEGLTKTKQLPDMPAGLMDNCEHRPANYENRACEMWEQGLRTVSTGPANCEHRACELWAQGLRTVSTGLRTVSTGPENCEHRSENCEHRAWELWAQVCSVNVRVRRK